MTWTRSSSLAASTARRISPGILSSMAFSRAGRLSVMRAMRPATAYLSVVYFIEPPTRYARSFDPARIAIHAHRDLVFRFRLALRLHLPAPAEGAAAGSRDRVPAGAVRGTAEPLGAERPGRTADQAPLH